MLSPALTMSKKVSAFQVYSEDQVHQRHARSYRNPQPRSQSGSYKSPPHRSGRNVIADWREDVKMDTRRQGRHSSSPEVRRDSRSYNDYDKYDSRRRDSNSYGRESRYREDAGQSDTVDHSAPQGRYRNDEEFERRSWERDDHRRDDYAADRDRGSNRLKDSYLIVEARRETADKVPRATAQYSDSDEECLHESLRRKKQNSQTFSEDEDQRRWSTDDDYSDYRQLRKQTVISDNYRSPSPTPAKVRRQERRYSSEEGRVNAQSYSDYGDDSDRGRQAAPEPPPKKKKAKGSKKKDKGKDKKRKAVVVQNSVLPPPPSAKIQSLMDVEIPPSVKQQIEGQTQQSSTPSLPRFGESRSEFKFGQRSEDTGDHSLSRSHDEERGRSRYDDSGRTRSRYDDDRYPDQRDLSGGRRDSESDKKGQHSHRESYSGRRSPDYDRRTYHHSDEEFDRDVDRQHRASFSRDSRNGSDVLSGAKRKRQSSVERRDWQRSGNRNTQKDRSPEFRTYSDSDQDSEREGGRRSWRDERRDRQPKKKDEERERIHKDKGDKKSKSRQGDSKDTKKSSGTKKEKHVDQEARYVEFVQFSFLFTFINALFYGHWNRHGGLVVKASAS